MESPEGDLPLQAALLNADQTDERARELAGEHRLPLGGPTESLLLRRLAENESVIRDTCRVLADTIKHQRRVTQAGEWLLDNLYQIDEQILKSRRH